MIFFFYLITQFQIFSSGTAQTAPAAEPLNLEGRWEVVSYSEQGVQVDKKKDALALAVAVYDHVREMRAHTWFGFNESDEPNRRVLRAYDRWEERDSTAEVKRLAAAIAMPYIAVFFADSTLSCYNKELNTNRIYFPEARHYIAHPSTNSCDITYPGVSAPYNYFQWRAQVLSYSAQRVILFLPEEAEIVELVKTPYSLP